MDIYVTEHPLQTQRIDYQLLQIGTAARALDLCTSFKDLVQ